MPLIFNKSRLFYFSSVDTRVDIEKVFEELGLSMYQAKVLAALIQYGKAKASDIAQLSGTRGLKFIPFWISLLIWGLVDKNPGRPIKYRPKSPEYIAKRFGRSII